ncbi:MAG: class I SAM-dependent methyltransferase, partial [Parvularculaceae bacterium]|nr:class I SAM-dependent methyltransferase [Parvularculaceae bacterium]
MVYHLKHAMLAEQNAADEARARFVLGFKRHLMKDIRAANGLAYKVQAEPAYRKEKGRAPQTRDEALEAYSLSPHYRYWAALNRTTQEMMWQTVAESIYRDEARMQGEAQKLTSPSAQKKGSLTLDPSFKADPAYAGDGIHLQPESYLANDDDGLSVASGAFYEMGGRLYSMGRGMAARDSKAACVIAYIHEKRPGWSPKRILDMGCSAGGASAPYAEEFPDAEVHAVDLGSSMLRYAHARAEALGQPVNFHQMDAAHTTFPDGYFDLIISHNLLHEISTKTRREVAAETKRLLAPGGLAIHQDVDLLFRGKTIWEEAERSWDLVHNHEPFWLEYATNEFEKELVDAGFAADKTLGTVLPKTDGPG